MVASGDSWMATWSCTFLLSSKACVRSRHTLRHTVVERCWRGICAIGEFPFVDLCEWHTSSAWDWIGGCANQNMWWVRTVVCSVKPLPSVVGWRNVVSVRCMLQQYISWVGCALVTCLLYWSIFHKDNWPILWRRFIRFSWRVWSPEL